MYTWNIKFMAIEKLNDTDKERHRDWQWGDTWAKRWCILSVYVYGWHRHGTQ